MLRYAAAAFAIVDAYERRYYALVIHAFPPFRR